MWEQILKLYVALGKLSHLLKSLTFLISEAEMIIPKLKSDYVDHIG